MTGGASETVKNFNSQATMLETRIAQAQMENEAKMARQRAVFEQKLKNQDKKNHAIVAKNTAISASIASLRRDNKGLQTRANELQEANRFKRTELKTLKEKFRIVSDFLSASLKATNDHGAKELAVLQQPHPITATQEQAHVRHRDDRHAEESGEGSSKEDEEDEDGDEDGADDAEDDDSQDHGASLLAMASKVRRTGAKKAMDFQLGQPADADSVDALGGNAPVATNADSKQFLGVLSSGVASLAEQEKIGEAQLKSLFVTELKAGIKRQAALLARQRSLNATRVSLESTKLRLESAEKHLVGTRAQLDTRLRGVGLFLQRLAHLSLAPAREAPRLLKALPGTISPQQAPDAPASGVPEPMVSPLAPAEASP